MANYEACGVFESVGWNLWRKGPLPFLCPPWASGCPSHGEQSPLGLSGSASLSVRKKMSVVFRYLGIWDSDTTVDQHWKQTHTKPISLAPWTLDLAKWGATKLNSAGWLGGVFFLRLIRQPIFSSAHTLLTCCCNFWRNLRILKKYFIIMSLRIDQEKLHESFLEIT